MKSSTGVRVRGAARARRRVRAALQPAPSGPLPAHPPAGAGRPPSLERASLSLSLMALGCSSSSHTLLWLREQVEHAGGSFQFPVGPHDWSSAIMGRRPAPVGSLLVWAKLWTSAPVLFLGGSVYAAPHVPGDPERRLPPPVSPAPVLWVSCESPCIFAFVFFFFFHCTTAWWGEGIP